MIDANDYPDLESLKKAMFSEINSEIARMLKFRYSLLKNDIYQMSMLIRDSFLGKYIELDKGLIKTRKEFNASKIYKIADRIEELANRSALTASIMKSTCRLIPSESKENDICEK